MSESTPVDLTEYLDSLLETIEKNEGSLAPISVNVEVGSPAYDALGLALGVSKLIDFGGGILRLTSGHRFKLLKPCEVCEVAAPAMLPRGVQSLFCARCADELANQYQGLCK